MSLSKLADFLLFRCHPPAWGIFGFKFKLTFEGHSMFTHGLEVPSCFLNLPPPPLARALLNTFPGRRRHRPHPPFYHRTILIIAGACSIFSIFTILPGTLGTSCKSGSSIIVNVCNKDDRNIDSISATNRWKLRFVTN